LKEDKKQDKLQKEKIPVTGFFLFEILILKLNLTVF
jgi:hypothetical protein